ncbi:MAG: glycoside hydrolase family 15 protein, partial [Deltaproteobacteria bacterium]|nr:glycoside hydrolase family 15 protein [Deltaproteobacteria bacterium]
LHTVALIGENASIDFMCFPRFDSPTIFAGLLDDARGGCFKIHPVLEGVRHKQLYLPDSNVLVSRFLSENGVAEVSDFMSVEDGGEPHTLVRRARTVRGEVRFRMLCAPRFDYARAHHTVERINDGVIFTSHGRDATALRLRTTTPVQIVNGDAAAEFTLPAGSSADFILEPATLDGDSPSSAQDYVSSSFKRTINYWRRWVARSNYQGRWREMVNRSALTLKLLTSQTHGSMVAGPTFGLPERIGGDRNWDYRFTWIRDASFSLYALMRLGYTGEAAAFMRWLEARICELKPDGSLQVMYGIDGRHELPEEILSHLEGYRKSTPVRIGNGAVNQLQLDIYGELMDAIYLYDKYGQPISYDTWQNITRLIEWVCAHWRENDETIWEFRTDRQEYLYSRLMCWVALDRAIRLAWKRSFPAPIARWHDIRDTIYRDIMEQFWNPVTGAFVQHKHTDALDASCLIMPLMRIVSPVDTRWLSTMRALEKDLLDDSLVYRYRGPDGFTGKEGTFCMCSFWYIESLSRSGDIRQARLLFERMLGYANHLGLYAEELGPSGEHLGNFPQAFTHVALISAAFDLNRRLSAANENSAPEA